MVNRTSRNVATFYQRFPYPTVYNLRKHLPETFATAQLNNRLERNGVPPLPEKQKIWVAGCGTRQGVNVALDFPQAEIYATDLSSASLKISKGFAKKLGLKNIVFEKADILKAGFNSKFDYIISYGVLHHMKSPLEGLKVIRKALKKTGVVELMVYNSHHRALNQAFQKILQTILPSSAGIAHRVDAGFLLADAILTSQYSSDLKSLIQSFDYKKDPADFADVFFNPQETSYTIPELQNWIQQGSFSFLEWKYPGLWKTARYFQDKNFLKVSAKISSWGKANIVYEVARDLSPYMEFYLVPNLVSLKPNAQLNSIDNKIPIGFQGRKIYSVKNHKIIESKFQPPYKIKNGQIHFETISAPGKQIWKIPLSTKNILKLCSGTKTTNAIFSDYSKSDLQKVKTWLTHLSEPDKGLIAFQ